MDWKRGLSFVNDEKSEVAKQARREETLKLLKSYGRGINSDGSSNDEDEQDELVAREPSKPALSTAVKAEQLDEFKSLFGGQSKREAREAVRRAEELKAEADWSKRELNPAFRNNASTQDQSTSNTSDTGGPSSQWLIQSYRRSIQMATEEGKRVEDVVAERYGSVAELEEMIAQAKSRERHEGSRDARGSADQARSRFQRPGQRDEGRRDRLSRDSRGRRSRSRSPSKRDRSPKQRDRSPAPRDRRRDDTAESEGRSSSSTDRKGRYLGNKGRDSPRRHRSPIKRGASPQRRRRSPGDRDGWKKPGRKDNCEVSTVETSNVREDSSPSKEVPAFVEDRKPDRQIKEAVQIDADLVKLDKNQLAARLLKANLTRNESLAARIRAAQAALETGGQAAAVAASREPASNKEEVLLTVSTKSGFTRPVDFSHQQGAAPAGRHGKTHDTEGARERYFADDDKIELKQMLADEKTISAEDQNQMYLTMTGKEKLSDDFSVDDMFVDKASNKRTVEKQHKREREQALRSQQAQTKTLAECQHCVGSVKRHLVVAMGLSAYLAVPADKPLTDMQCVIVPREHCVSSTLLDEEVWEEVQLFKKSLVKAFRAADQDVVFTEMCRASKGGRHMVVECYPLEGEGAELAPMYFKKALLECEGMWSTNKKCVDIKQDIRHTVPAGMDFYSVEFSPNQGFAHVIEEMNEFPESFGREVLSGLVDCDPLQWRRGKKARAGDDFESQSRRVLAVQKLYEAFDWTKKIDVGDVGT